MRGKELRLDTFAMRGILAGTRTQIMVPCDKSVGETEYLKYSKGTSVCLKEPWRVVYLTGSLTLPDKEGILYRADYRFKSCAVKRYWCGNPDWRPACNLPTKYARMHVKVTESRILYLKDITKEDLTLQGFTRKDRVVRFVEYWDSRNPAAYRYVRDPAVIAYTFEVSEV